MQVAIDFHSALLASAAEETILIGFGDMFSSNGLVMSPEVRIERAFEFRAAAHIVAGLQVVFGTLHDIGHSYV